MKTLSTHVTIFAKWENPVTATDLARCIKIHGDRSFRKSTGGSYGFLYSCWTVQPPATKYAEKRNLMRLEEKLLKKDYGRHITVINILKLEDISLHTYVERKR